MVRIVAFKASDVGSIPTSPVYISLQVQSTCLTPLVSFKTYRLA